MTTYSGRDGSLYVDNQRVGKVSNWSLASSVETLDNTSLGDMERSYTPGLKSATGSATVFYHDDAPKVLLSKVIKNAGVRDTEIVLLSLRWGAKRVDVNAIITQGEITSQVGNVMQAQISFTVTGDYQKITL